MELGTDATTRPTRKWPLFDDEDYDNNYVIAKRSKRQQPNRWIKDPNMGYLTADEITDDMLNNVSDYLSKKIYDDYGRRLMF